MIELENHAVLQQGIRVNGGLFASGFSYPSA